jgi:crossover junction endodeoxyribonuclease RuvC
MSEETAATPKVLGLDLSLSGTGVAGANWTATIKPPAKLRDVARLDWILSAILDRAADVDLVVVEGPAYSRQASQQGHHERAGLWWVTIRALWRRGVPYAVVTPGGLKRYATGKGTASKDEVLVAVTRRFDWFAGDNNAADALVLAAMGADHLGTPLATMPDKHRGALDAVTWPDLKPRQPMPGPPTLDELRLASDFPDNRTLGARTAAERPVDLHWGIRA